MAVLGQTTAVPCPCQRQERDCETSGDITPVCGSGTACTTGCIHVSRPSMSTVCRNDVSVLLGHIYAFGSHGGSIAGSSAAVSKEKCLWPDLCLIQQAAWWDCQEVLRKVPGCFAIAAEPEELAGKGCQKHFLLSATVSPMLSLRCSWMASSPQFLKAMSSLWQAEGNTIVFHTFSFK